MRSLLAIQDQLKLEVDFIARKKPGNRTERLKGCAGGQEIQITGQRKWSDHNSNPSLRLPDFVAYNGAYAELTGIRGTLLKTALGILVEAVPGAHKLLNLNRSLKVIAEEQPQSRGRARLLSQQSK